MSEPPARRTVSTRRVLSPVLVEACRDGYAPSHEYVRRFWIAVLGPGAVADLLRLTAAAHSGRSLKEPVHLPVLVKAGLAIRLNGSVAVADRIPPVPAHIVASLPAPLRRAHARTELIAS